MRVIYRWRSIANWIVPARGFEFNSSRSFCSSRHNSKPTACDSSSSSSSRNGSASSPPSMSNYDDQYKALQNLDFPTAAKILFSDPPKKKKFGFDFHVVQFFIACLPSLAVYLVAQYARSEMRKMDAELEKKKQAEFEAQAKEMERKAAEEKASMESNPQLLEVKERLEKLEGRVKEIAVASKKPLDDSITAGEEAADERKRAAQVETDNIQNKSSMNTSNERGTVSAEGKAKESEPSTPLQSNKNDDKSGGTFQEAKK